MNRLIEKMVFSGFVTAWRLATWPTRISPSLVKATTEGVMRLPSWLGMTRGCPSITATTEVGGAEVDADQLAHRGSSLSVVMA
jgi:hypothetical protein